MRLVDHLKSKVDAGAMLVLSWALSFCPLRIGRLGL